MRLWARRLWTISAGVTLCASGATGGLAFAQSAAPAPTVTLTVAAYPAVDEIVRSAIPAWRKLHPEVDVRVVSRELNDHHTAMTTGLSTGKGLPDVMAVEVGYLGRFAQGKGLTDLSQPPYDVRRFQPRFVAYAFEQATTPAGAVLAVPTDIGPGTMLYRHDLLARAGLKEADLTRSWEGYVAAGLTIKAATGAYLLAHARDMKDILIRTGLQPGEGLYYDKDSRPLVTSPRFVRAFELSLAVRRQKLDAKATAWSSDWSEGFKRGGIATQMSGAWLAGHLNTWLAPGTRGKWRATQLPEGAFAAYGGSFFAIARASDPARKAMAWELIQFLTMNRPQQLAAFKAQDAFPALLDAHQDPFFDEPLPFLGGQAARRDWREATLHTRAVPVHKQDNFAREVIDTELDKVLDRGKDIPTALADAQRLLLLRAHR